MRSFLPEGRWQRLALLATVVVAVGMQATRWDWFIDDAAICWAYARNIAAGDGFVAQPGGERVEGVSDPTWMALLTLFQMFGVPGMNSVRPLSVAFTVATLPVLWRTARDAMPDDDGTASLVAPFAFAVYAQNAIWGASGLENPLWSFLLAVAVWATARDAHEGRFLRSSTAWLLLAWTRPEGIAYAALGGAWWLLHLVRAGHAPLRPTIAWLTVFFVPTALLTAARWWYFAWPVSNTWYAKVQVRPTWPSAWHGRGWSQLREWAGRLWYGWMFPVYLLGLVGRVGTGPKVAAAVTAALAASFVWPDWVGSPDDAPRAFVLARMAGLAAAGVGFPLLALGRAGAPITGLAWCCATGSLAFSVYANGDWMGAYRWMSLLTAPAAVLFAVGFREVARWLRDVVPDPSVAQIATALTLFALVPPNLDQIRDHRNFNHNETPSMVAHRARFTEGLARDAFFEGRVVNVDMDMGAHLWLQPEVTQLDMAGLVDVPMSRHWYHQRPFVEEYVYTEHVPTFAHVHAGWARESRLKTYPWFERWMVEVGPYLDEEPLPPHPGVFANRALFTEPTWPHGDGQRVELGGGVSFEGVYVPETTWAPGREGYFEVGFRRDRAEDFRVVAFLSRQGRVRSQDLSIGYGEYPASRWLVGEEVYVGRYAFRVPTSTAEGDWDLGFVVLDADGRPLGPDADAADPAGGVIGRDNAAHYAMGEVRFPALVHVASREAADARERQHLADVDAAAAEGRCEDAEAAWIVARRVRPRAWRHHEAQLEHVAPALAACWARRGEADGVDALARAHDWDHRSPELERVGGPIGEAMWAEGLAARDAGDAEAAYRAFSSLLRFQPWRAWARRYAEDARDTRLGLVRGSHVDTQEEDSEAAAQEMK